MLPEMIVLETGLRRWYSSAMKNTLFAIALGAVAAIAMYAQTATEDIKKAGTATVDATKKVGKKTGEVTVDGAKKAGGVTKRVGKKVASATVTGSKKVANVSAEKLEQGAKKVGDATK
jgi:NADH/NAD ratio-sensing transcriptional regulator Rex